MKYIYTIILMLTITSVCFAGVTYTENADGSADWILQYHRNDRLKLRKLMDNFTQYLCKASENKITNCPNPTRQQQARMIHDHLMTYMKQVATQWDIMLAVELATQTTNSNADYDNE